MKRNKMYRDQKVKLTLFMDYIIIYVENINGEIYLVNGLEDSALLYDVNSLQMDLQTQCNPYKNPFRLFYRNEPGDSERYIETQQPRIAKTTLKKDSKADRLTYLI